MKNAKLNLLLVLFTIMMVVTTRAENGYNLWLRYQRIENTDLRMQYLNKFARISLLGKSETVQAINKELNYALPLMFQSPIVVYSEYKKAAAGAFISKDNAQNLRATCLFCVNRVIIGTKDDLKGLEELNLTIDYSKCGDEGFIIKWVKHQDSDILLITATTYTGLLYGTFGFLNCLQQQVSLNEFACESSPKIKNRVLDHWDNLDRTIERGYAGISIWDWQKLPDYIDQRYIDYARANASVGINGTVLNNVNASSWILTPMFLQKVTALANTFRPYGIKVYLTARFSAPMELGGLKTADPLDKEVQLWWKQKVDEIYALIPDFGGFLVKANSEGQPGPQNYGRTHADGANMLADILAPYNGIVMWRAFVYEPGGDDRAKQAYNEFKPLDGQFRPNVLVQVKNGPIDFQPREPFHPLFGAMPKTSLMMEFQLTQEYTGCATHLFYEAPLFRETLDADTYAKGQGSTVGKVIDGSLDNHPISGIAGVANVGNDINWCGHPFAQANWYAFGRLAWDYQLPADKIASEWLKMTFSVDAGFVAPATQLMMQSRENLVNYMTPLGLHHIMAYNHHYGPGPWVKDGRADWTSVYYHKADQAGIGFDRTASGSNAISEYAPEFQNQMSNIETCPLQYLLWFHHVSWDQKLSTGRSLWDELCYRYQTGVDNTRAMQQSWDQLATFVDDQRFAQVSALLKIQGNEATWWRDACLLYFQQFSQKPLPMGVEKPAKTLQEYESMQFKYVPGIKNE